MISSKTFKIIGVEHIGIAMNDNEKIESFLRLLYGMNYTGSEIIEDQMVKTDIYATKDAKIELLNSTSSNSIIEKYINKKGNGIHHIALRVDNLENAIMELSDNGVEFIDKKPNIGVEDCMIAFIHPRSTGGILFELCQRS